MKYVLILLILSLSLSGCTLERQSRADTKVHLFNPFYRPGGNPTGPAFKTTTQTPENMGGWR